MSHKIKYLGFFLFFILFPVNSQRYVVLTPSCVLKDHSSPVMPEIEPRLAKCQIQQDKCLSIILSLQPLVFSKNEVVLFLLPY